MSKLNQAVGDIETRDELIRALLIGDSEEVAYGPLTLRQVEDDNILPLGTDGRIYQLIKPDTQTDEFVLYARLKADQRVLKALG